MTAEDAALDALAAALAPRILRLIRAELAPSDHDAGIAVLRDMGLDVDRPPQGPVWRQPDVIASPEPVVR